MTQEQDDKNMDKLLGEAHKELVISCLNEDRAKMQQMGLNIAGKFAAHSVVLSGLSLSVYFGALTLHHFQFLLAVQSLVLLYHAFSTYTRLGELVSASTSSRILDHWFDKKKNEAHGNGR